MFSNRGIKVSVRAAPQERRWSILRRLTIWYAVSASAIVFVLASLFYARIARLLLKEDDQLLADKVETVRALLAERPVDFAEIRREVVLELVPQHNEPLYIRVLGERGGSLIETPGMAVALPSHIFSELRKDKPTVRPSQIAFGGHFFRATTVLAPGPGNHSRVIQIGLDRTGEVQLLARYRSELSVILLLAVCATALAGYAIARRGLLPLAMISDTARRIRASRLDERIGTSGVPAELFSLVETLNAMLDRLEDSFARLTQFSADIAHELRTPVHNLRGETEVALSRERSAEEYRETLGSCLEECERLSKLIDSLLFLARSESPQTHIQRESVNLRRELETMAAFYEALASEASVTLAVRGHEQLEVLLDRTLFHRALGNLVENALSHTPVGGTVTLSAAGSNSAARIEVSDTGCGIPSEHLPRVFDRFYRTDQARSSSSAGRAGLGLSIVRRIAELHAGRVEIASELGRGTRVTLLLPSR
jgi:two-component system, OmpR family, heavy metal sensor histidine kinase CusS